MGICWLESRSEHFLALRFLVNRLNSLNLNSLYHGITKKKHFIEKEKNKEMLVIEAERQ